MLCIFIFYVKSLKKRKTEMDFYMKAQSIHILLDAIEILGQTLV